MNRKLTCFFAALPLLFAATLNAQATQTQMFMDSYGPALTEITSPGSTNPLGNTVNSPTLNLPYYSGSAASLTGVTFTLMAGFDSTGSVVNSSATAVTAQANESADFLLESPAIPSASGPILTLTASDNTGFTSFASGAGGTAVTFNASAMQSFGGGSAGSDLVLSDFVGAPGSTFPVDFASIVTTSFTGGGGNLDFLVDTNATIKATVEYEFVPEPSGFSLLFVAGLGLLGFRRKR